MNPHYEQAIKLANYDNNTLLEYFYEENGKNFKNFVDYADQKEKIKPTIDELFKNECFTPKNILRIIEDNKEKINFFFVMILFELIDKFKKNPKFVFNIKEDLTEQREKELFDFFGKVQEKSLSWLEIFDFIEKNKDWVDITVKQSYKDDEEE